MPVKDVVCQMPIDQNMGTSLCIQSPFSVHQHSFGFILTHNPLCSRLMSKTVKGCRVITKLNVPIECKLEPYVL